MPENDHDRTLRAPRRPDTPQTDGAAELCRCHRPLTPPDRPHWYPHREPEPGPEVRIVVLDGDDPGFLRMERVRGGWHARGAAAPHPELAPPEPWSETGLCWAGTRHAVVEATPAEDRGHTA